MERKQRLYIYDRKEIAVLSTVCVLITAFAFTAGVHYGKKIAPPGSPPPGESGNALSTQGDKVPSRREISEAAPGVSEAIDDTLQKSLHEEVARTGVQLERARQVELPSETRAERKGVAQEGLQEKEESLAGPLALSAEKRPPPAGKFTLQVGSFPTVEEARDLIDSLEALGIKPFLRSVDLDKKSKAFRVFLGGYASREDAEDAGARYRAKNIIDTFVVANRVD